MSSTIPIYSIHNKFDLFADPVHVPITFGNEGFILTQQDQRNIVDRRTWYLSRPAYNPTPPPYAAQPNPVQPTLGAAQISLQELLFQLVTFLSTYPPHSPHSPVIPTMPNQSCNFHYEKQTSTDDLPYFRRLAYGGPYCAESKLAPVMAQRVQYIVSRSIRDAAVNTDEPQARQAETTAAPMDYDPGEGTSTDASPEGFADYCLMKPKKDKKVTFW